MNLPNKLTIARVVAVPFFIAAYMTGFYLVAFVLFIAASLTDMLDGKIARKYNLVTNFGKIMEFSSLMAYPSTKKATLSRSPTKTG